MPEIATDDQTTAVLPAPAPSLVVVGMRGAGSELGAADAGAGVGGSSPATLPPELFARIAKALADPRRFTILERIAAEPEVACQRLCEDLPVAQATVSHHVKELVVAGLVETRRDGQFVYYRFIPAVLQHYRDTLAARLRM